MLRAGGTSDATLAAAVAAGVIERTDGVVGFHFRDSDLEGSALGRRVGRYVAATRFQPVGSRRPGRGGL